MRIIFEGEVKEIAALVLEVQERYGFDWEHFHKSLIKSLETTQSQPTRADELFRSHL